ncbi:lipid A export permease/ATP-binding protein MsbA [bacterium SCSIO 12696]|nr:lipid A export permease/ATP-binding protein MsbA [bacterium SCSIO 12696]
MSTPDTESTSQQRSDRELCFRLLGYVKPYWLIFLLSSLALMLFSAMNAAFLDLLKILLDYLTQLGIEVDLDGQTAALANANDKPSVIEELVIYLWGSDAYQTMMADARLAIPALFVAVALVRGLGFLAGTYGMAFVSSMLVHNLRTELFNKMTRLPASYFDANMSGHMITKLTYQVTQVSDSLTNATKTVVTESSMVLFYLLLMLSYSWQLTLVFLAVVPIIALVVSVVSKSFRRISHRIQGAMGDVTQVSQELVNSYRVMRLFGGERYERGRMDDASQVNRRQVVKMGLVQGLSSPVIQLIISAAMGLLIFWALDPGFIADIKANTLVIFLIAAGSMTRPVRKLTSIMEPVQRGLAAGQSIFETIDAEEEKDSGSRTLDKVKGEFCFDKVSFAYNDQDGPVLQDISFKVSAGETIALVGSSGSGKSTLVNLIPRFYCYNGGCLSLDGIDVNDICLTHLRSHIAFVNQQVTLFNDTVYNNIAYGELAALPREKVIEAARAANALEFIERLPNGWDTVVGDGGGLLSGGQRQRLVIARALLKDSPILILDEATSALDTQSERRIQMALEELMQDRTTFVIAHRLTTIESADRILVMEAGRIVEQGTHSDLLAAEGRYAQLHRRGFDESSNGG